MTYSTNKTVGQWKAHGHYIARESASLKEGTRAVGFSATKTAVDVAGRLASWQAAGDERMFKIIVSPEFGERMDVENHTRDLMRRIERSLLTKLEWVAVVHHNTEHMHVHIALRGLDDRGASLRLAPAFIQSGIRRHAEELATRELGYRTERDALRRSAERFNNFGSPAWIESFSAAAAGMRIISQSAKSHSAQLR